MTKITKQEAREYLLKYHHLHSPRRLKSDEDVLKFIRKVGCIQYDPLRTTARNADLVLQSRCRNYSEELLYRLLYEKRQLLDGWDKCMSIWPVEDWPYFARKRKDYKKAYADKARELKPIRKQVTEWIGEHGHVSSKDIDDGKKVDWSWAPTSVARAALEAMYHCGELVVHHRQGTRKFYGLTKNLLPEPVLGSSDPNKRMNDFNDWYLKRRIGSIGMLWNKPSDAYLGCHFKRGERDRAVKRLIDNDEISEVRIEGVKEPFYLLRKDLKLLEDTKKASEASFIAPLDNLIWDRNLIQELFGFFYRWEVYTPLKKRKYGYYVLPILYRDKFIGRCEPVMDSKTKTLTMKNWWWEKDAAIDQDTRDALFGCLRDFCTFLDARKIVISKELPKNIKWIKDCV